MRTQELINTLVEQTQTLMDQAERLKIQDLSSLNWRSKPLSWNILECYEHLNRYGDFYLPQIASKIKQSHTKSEPFFKPGFLGNYFANSMLPKDKLNKMKTFKDKDPLNASLDRKVIDHFLQQQVILLDLLDQSHRVSLNKVKISTSISNLIKLKLGDTFRFYINHMIRHSKQIDRITEKWPQPRQRLRSSTFETIRSQIPAGSARLPEVSSFSGRRFWMVITKNRQLPKKMILR